MPLNNNSINNNINSPIIHFPSGGIDAAACTKIADDRESIMTRSPSPPNDDIVDSNEPVTVKELGVDDHNRGNGPSLANHRSMSSKFGSKLKNGRGSSMFKSFTSRGSGAGGNDGGTTAMGEILASGSWGAGDEDDNDTINSSNSKHSSSMGNAASHHFNHRTNGDGNLPNARGRRRLLKSSGLMSSFSRKKGGSSNHSSHPTGGHHLSHLMEEEDIPLNPNSDHNAELTDIIQANSQDNGMGSPAEVARMLHEGSYEDDFGADTDDSSSAGDGGGGARSRSRQRSRRSRQSSDLSSFTSAGSNLHNELDLEEPHTMNSQALLDSMGDSPSTEQLANIAAVRANEYIEECLSANVCVLDRKQWESIPEYAKTDLLVGQHLGKGSFSDAFEVIASVTGVEESVPTVESLGEDMLDLGLMMERKFQGSIRGAEGGRRGEGGGKDGGSDTKGDLDAEIDAMFGRASGGPSGAPSEECDDLDAEIDAMFGGASGVIKEDVSDRDEKIQPKGGTDEEDLDGEIDAMFGNIGNNVAKAYAPKPKHPASNRRAVNRRASTSGNVGASICLGTVASRNASSRSMNKPQVRKVVLAMKCLRPQIRSNAEQFMIGVEDLVHETAMLASLDHPNIVKLHGRAVGCASNSFRLSDGYFILLDRLKDTLEDRMNRWKKTCDKKAPPTITQVRTAYSVADALAYLHSHNIVFRDLKPANVGFDSAGILKLFDFGFAIGIEEPPSSVCGSELSENSDESQGHLLYDRCGTPRYMAPEVGLESGYGLPADVYSFGILLWEICALKKPFANVRSANEFHKSIFEKGIRPKLKNHWPKVLIETMEKCWSTFPIARPAMSHVKSMLAAHAMELSMQQKNNGNRKDDLRRSSMFRRFKG
mmetsp:Transcript_36669/g.67980  ORF Transcript_36669/g.67980 Transcript_36669/m.67980 type:complete len:879 (+) Transcript_36669:180-2816(+)